MLHDPKLKLTAESKVLLLKDLQGMVDNGNFFIPHNSIGDSLRDTPIKSHG